ncbi:alkaline phosphatase PafA [Hugenholtzia roseola]|uniref:alkaline phosphatase PafA n=1 Tax=Hugenholtzia roseola TaxID=1002 RepID=UPI0013779DF1|nr:alkaline phosphatase PafA [Hugenholtzia roseola]
MQINAFKNIAFLLSLITIFSFSFDAKGQQIEKEAIKSKKNNPKPKLIVGIVIDQMRADYYARFRHKLGEGGFKRLYQNGFVCKNAHYDYIPTNTAPGHASIFTGTTPAYHGIMDNYWFDRKSKNVVYCVEDSTQKTVGSANDNGKMSPHRLKSSTLTDQLFLHTQKGAKIIGISHKDRGAILPAGHFPKAAFWYDKNTGKMISSSYYLTALPDWVVDFNNQKIPDSYLKGTWETLLPLDSYQESLPDSNAYEKNIIAQAPTTFPYRFAEIVNDLNKYEFFLNTPFAATFLKDFAKQVIRAEQMGEDQVPDFLTLSFSSTDYMGHNYGIDAVEIEDAYLRLDKDLADFLNFLDVQVGKDEYLIFLTADHGAPHVPAYLRDNGYKVSCVPMRAYKDELNEHLNIELKKLLTSKKWQENQSFVLELDEPRLVLDRELLSSYDIEIEKAQKIATNFLLSLDGIYKVFPAYQIENNTLADAQEALIRRGYNQKYAPDALFFFEPQWISSYYGAGKGQTHGSSYTYDTHVPMLFYGAGIPQGDTQRRVAISDLAPTVAAWLEIAFPDACIGNPIEELFEAAKQEKE